ncbi:ABC transporter ATP-binding protein [Paenibacillus tyrfis]|uniref:ABC transporter ATP-binding protein n=1 Tax=Paenibacillus tyrfis TaxID=1501230 RepID=UPI00209F1420|nr:dipeptide/oligopeptide/nickel ABC transporter ATP-binding protein [Paenibacillus tyrfis]MCP1305612.1 dipeptide/oligopeptide/nickel ABC transporter ATP-binding protein [Paenibacillus tyrfis]
MSRLLDVRQLSKTFIQNGSAVPAVQDVSFNIDEGECLGLVGESGSGKSTLARILLALERPDRGEITLAGRSLLTLKGSALREVRQHMQVVFQDPTASLNQRLPIWRSVIEPLDNFPQVTPSFLTEVRHSRRAAAARLLEMVGLPADFLDRYPHEMSGGQRQRAAISRGISLGPKLLICDEPTSSLDVSVQAQILQLLKTMQAQLGMACLFISHDIAAVQSVSDRIIVMKGGRIVDRFASGQLMDADRDEYTRRLVEAVSE